MGLDEAKIGRGLAWMRRQEKEEMRELMERRCPPPAGPLEVEEGWVEEGSCVCGCDTAVGSRG